MDLKYALRSLRKSPGFTLLAIVVMALGIGANTAVFSVVNAVLLKPLAYSDPDRIVTLATFWKKSATHGWVSAPDFKDWHDQSTAFTAMAYYFNFDTAVTVGSTPEYAHVARVSPEFFSVFNVAPPVGSLWISDSYSRNHFGGPTRAVGRTVRISDQARAIAGVLPPGFHFPDQTDIWIAADMNRIEDRSSHNYFAVGRLKNDVSLDQAQAQMTSIGSRLERQYPNSNQDKGIVVALMRDDMVRDVRMTLILLLGAVGVLLLIACANMANLLLAKATARSREMAIRAAVGASRGRIVRQLITESFVLAAASGAAGLLLAVWGSAALVALAPQDVPRLAEAGIDGWVLAFTCGVSMLASLVFGLAPALQASRVDLNEALKQGATRAVIGGRAGRIRNTLVVAEIALSVVLLVGAGLLLKSFVALNNVTLGYSPERVMVMSTNVPTRDLDGARRAARLYKDLLADIATIPGVTATGGTRSVPGRVMSSGGYYADHLPPERERSIVTTPQAVFSMVTPGAFATLRIPIAGGRDFNDSDSSDGPPAAIINQTLANRAFPGVDPVGHVIFCGFDQAGMKGMKIIGVVGDVRQWGPARDPWPEIYMPHEQHPFASTALSVMVRTTADPAALSRVLQRKVRDRSTDVPVRFTTLEASLSENVAAPRFRTLLLGIFAGLAVCLAMAGVYGVMAYVVGQRSNEIGLRMALGASSGDVLRLVLRQGMVLAAIGLAIGLVAAVAASRLLTSMLFVVKPTDPWTYAAVAVVLATVALAASYLPARRAARVDPLVALRQE